MSSVSGINCVYVCVRVSVCVCVCVGGKSGCLFVRYSTGGRCSLSNLKLTFKEAAAKIRGVQTRVYGICMYVCMYVGVCIHVLTCVCVYMVIVCVCIYGRL